MYMGEVQELGGLKKAFKKVKKAVKKTVKKVAKVALPVVGAAGGAFVGLKVGKAAAKLIAPKKKKKAAPVTDPIAEKLPVASRDARKVREARTSRKKRTPKLNPATIASPIKEESFPEIAAPAATTAFTGGGGNFAQPISNENLPVLDEVEVTAQRPNHVPLMLAGGALLLLALRKKGK